MLASCVHDAEALREHGPMLGYPFVLVPLACVCDETTSPYVMPRAVGHRCQSMGGKLTPVVRVPFPAGLRRAQVRIYPLPIG